VCGSCLHVEYTERGKEYGIIFILSLFCENSHLEYIRIYVKYRVHQAEYVVHVVVVASQEYLNIYSTSRVSWLPSLAARYLENKTRRFFDCFRAPPPSCFPGFTRG